MRSAATALTLALALLLGACSSLLTDADLGEPVEITRLRAEPYSFAYYSGLDEPLQLVVRDAETWRTTWEGIHGHQSPVPPLPAVDFEREMLIVAALGTRSSGGYTILVEAVYEQPRHLSTMIRSISPGRACMTSDALTQPLDIARLPRSEKPVHFRTLHSVNSCR